MVYEKTVILDEDLNGENMNTENEFLDKAKYNKFIQNNIVEKKDIPKAIVKNAKEYIKNNYNNTKIVKNRQIKYPKLNM